MIFNQKLKKEKSKRFRYFLKMIFHCTLYNASQCNAALCEWNNDFILPDFEYTVSQDVFQYKYNFGNVGTKTYRFQNPNGIIY